ncbi:MAG: hypothetical protein WA231_05565 [Methylocella sp.]
MAEENVPLSWYAILKGTMQPYFDMFELMTNPRLEPLDVILEPSRISGIDHAYGQKCGKLTYSGFDGYVDYEGVLRETQELVALLTGTLGISQRPGPLSIVNIVGVFADGREEKFPPHERPVRIMVDRINVVSVRQPGFPPRRTLEQYIMEHVIRSDDRLVKDVLHYLSNPPDYLYKILEVITKDLGKGSKPKGFSLIEERRWATKTDLDAFKNAAEFHRHWDQPAPQMKLQEAVLMSRQIIKGWVAERAGLQYPK